MNKSHIRLSVDELISQNKFLNESNRNLSEELDNLRLTLKKYKQSPPKDSGVAKSVNFPVEAITSTLNKTEVKSLLKTVEKILAEYNSKSEQSQLVSSSVDSSLFELIADLKLVIESLLEAVNDKFIACSHQRKVNKMLATRIQDLEKQVEQYHQQQQTQFSFSNTPATPTDRKTHAFPPVLASVSPFSSMPASAVAACGLNLEEPLMPMTMTAPSPTEAQKMLDESLINFDTASSNFN